MNCYYNYYDIVTMMITLISDNRDMTLVIKII